MPRFLTQCLFVSLAGWILCAGSAPVSMAWGQEVAPQQKGPPALLPRRAQASNQTAAVVMGKAIASSEVEKVVSQIKKANPSMSEEALFWEVRKDLAVKTLIAETARLYADEISDNEVIRFHKLVYENEEREIRENLEERRNDYLIELYLEGRLGRSQRLKGVSPDYAEFIRVTPNELRTSFRQYNAMVADEEPMIRLAQFLFIESDFAGKEDMVEEVEACREKLKALEPDETRLRAVAELTRGCRFKIVEPKSLQKEFQQFAMNGKTGDVSTPFPLGRGAVLYYILSRQEREVLTFSEFQDNFMNRLIRNKIVAAKESIIHSLILEADYYPLDLFFKTTQQRASQFKR